MQCCLNILTAAHSLSCFSSAGSCNILFMNPVTGCGIALRSSIWKVSGSIPDANLFVLLPHNKTARFHIFLITPPLPRNLWRSPIVIRQRHNRFFIYIFLFLRPLALTALFTKKIKNLRNRSLRLCSLK